MVQYRVKHITYADGETVYVPQVKIWLIWHNMVDVKFRVSKICQSLDSAKRHIQDIKDSKLKSYLRNKVTKISIL